MKSAFYDERSAREQLAAFVRSTNVFSMGPECAQFEERFAKHQGRAYAVFVSSGSMANLVLIQALLNLGILNVGDRVGVSALTWATNVMPLIQLGLVPIALDCELATLNVSPEILARDGRGLRALFLTNVLGFADNIRAIADYCASEGILLLEDNCEALGSRAYGTLLGDFGFASTFSFFVGHHLSTVEGGMICTDDEELAHMLTSVRAHGWDRNLPEYQQRQWRAQYGIDPFYARYTFYDLAYNARPTEISGFLGNLQLDALDGAIKLREGQFHRFNKALARNAHFIRLSVEHMEVISNFAMPVLTTSASAFMHYRQRFEHSGVEIRPIIAGDITRQPFYRKYVAERSRSLNSRFVHQHGFYFPNNPELTPEELSTLEGLLE